MKKTWKKKYTAYDANMNGWVYIITNKSMSGLVKVGYSMRDPETRARELDNTGSPHKYTVEYSVLVKNPREVEQQTHRELHNCKEGKEWFRCTASVAVVAIRANCAEIISEDCKILSPYDIKKQEYERNKEIIQEKSEVYFENTIKDTDKRYDEYVQTFKHELEDIGGWFYFIAVVVFFMFLFPIWKDSKSEGLIFFVTTLYLAIFIGYFIHKTKLKENQAYKTDNRYLEFEARRKREHDATKKEYNNWLKAKNENMQLEGELRLLESQGQDTSPLIEEKKISKKPVNHQLNLFDDIKKHNQQQAIQRYWAEVEYGHPDVYKVLQGESRVKFIEELMTWAKSQPDDQIPLIMEVIQGTPTAQQTNYVLSEWKLSIKTTQKLESNMEEVKVAPQENPVKTMVECPYCAQKVRIISNRCGFIICPTCHKKFHVLSNEGESKTQPVYPT